MESMQSFKAVVKNGRLVVDEPTKLPEGTELVLTAGHWVTLSPEDQADLRAGIEAAERGELRPVTREELDHWAETGEVPEPLVQSALCGPRDACTKFLTRDRADPLHLESAAHRHPVALVKDHLPRQATNDR